MRRKHLQMRKGTVCGARNRGPGLYVLCLLLVLLCAPHPARAEELKHAGTTPPEDPLAGRIQESPSLPDLIESAYRRNPAIRAARQAWRAKIEELRVVTALPDPMLTGTYFPEPIETRLGPQDWNLNISQAIPFPGKLSKKGEMVRADAELARLELDRTVRDVVVKVRESYHELLYIQTARRIAERNKALVDQARAIAETGHAQDRAAFVDVAKAQSQVAQLHYDIILLDDLYETEAARLNALLDRTPGAPFGRFGELPLEPLAYSLEEIYALARSGQEEIRMADARVRKAEAGQDLARLQYLPDFRLGLFYAGIGRPDLPTPPPDAGRDALGIQAGITLPLWFGKNNGRLAGAEAGRRRARALKEARINETNAAVRSVYFRLRNAERLVRLYRDQLLPQAARSVEVAEVWFREGEGSFSDFIETEAVWYNFELSLARARADYGKSLARLERLVGRSLTRRDAPSAGEDADGEGEAPPEVTP